MIKFQDFEFYDLKEVAEMLRVNHLTLRKYIWSNRIPCKRIFRKIYIKTEDLKNFLTAENR